MRKVVEGERVARGLFANRRSRCSPIDWQLLCNRAIARYSSSMNQNEPTRSEVESAVLAYVTAPNYQPVKPKVIARKLGFSTDQHSHVRRAIKRLVKRHELAWGTKHLVKVAARKVTPAGPSEQPPQPEHEAETKLNLPAVDEKKGDRTALEVSSSDPARTPLDIEVEAPQGRNKPDREKKAKTTSGVFRRAAAGFGFVRPPGGSPERHDDIFIPFHKTMDAANGDLVAVRLDNRSLPKRDARLSGAIVEIIERETHCFVGVYDERDDFGFVQVDGGVFAQDIFVGDPGAKSASPMDKVVIEMVRFPSPRHEGEAVIVEVLGPRGQPKVDTLSIIREFDLPEEFSEEVMAAAHAESEAFDESIEDDRDDLTSATVITIDPADARDFDDAISLERLENGHFRLGVHIADVAHFVQPGSTLDEEARERATSIYLPDMVIPMLPEVISNNLASLQPGRVRYAKTVMMEFTPDGVRVASEYRRAAIKSDHRFTYEEVDEFLADRAPWASRLTPEVFTLLSDMHELAMTLRRRRLDAGAIELTLPEVKIDLDKKGRVKGAHVIQNTESHQIIEEFMLAANESAADLLHEKKWNFLRRIHETPDPRKLQALSEFVRGLGIECESLESRFEIKRVVEAVVGQPEERAVHYAVLRSMKKARYGPDVEGHYALHSKNYCHFTSPIRRYPDLTVHRMLDALLVAKRPADDFDQMALLGEHCSVREQRAEQAERELIRVKLLTYLKEKVGEQMDAVVTGVTKYGLFAQGIELPAEGLLHIKSLVDDTYDFEPQSHSLVGRRGNTFRLGDLIRVEIARVDPDLRELDFRLVHKTERAKPRRSAEKKRAGKSKREGKKASKPTSGKLTSGKPGKAAKKNKGGKRKPR